MLPAWRGRLEENEVEASCGHEVEIGRIGFSSHDTVMQSHLRSGCLPRIRRGVSHEKGIRAVFERKSPARKTQALKGEGPARAGTNPRPNDWANAPFEFEPFPPRRV